MAPNKSILNRQRSYVMTPRSGGGGGRSMFVIDPKTLATRLLVKPSIGALDGTNSRLVRVFVWLKNLSERWFSHVMLLAALIIYACIGGWIFSSIEGDYEAEQNAIIRRLHEPIEEITEHTVKQLWLFRNRFSMPSNLIGGERAPPVDINWSRRVIRLLSRFESTVMDQCSQRHNYSIESFTETDHWNFMGSVFFSMTVFTTIGYGDNPPKTTTGKAVTMIYAFVGIPLLLMVLADFGKIFTRSIKFLVLFFRRLYYLRSLRSVRRIGRQATRTAKVQEAILDALSRIQRQPPFHVDPKTGRVSMLPPPVITSPTPPPVVASGGTLPRVTFSPATPSTTITPETPMPPETLLTFNELDDEFNLPISLALFILMLYLLLGAIMFWSSESWSLFHAFYFVFISMSTIGFGDFVPSKIHVLMNAFIYLLFGLALTSMCINVIQEKLSSTFEKARVSIGETIGLDPTTPITIVAPSNSGSSSNSKKSSPANSRKSSTNATNKESTKVQTQSPPNPIDNTERDRRKQAPIPPPRQSKNTVLV